jgi:hypothetical protein
MREVLAEAISLVNLPFTVLLGLFMLYWLLVSLGALDDSESDLDGDLDGDADGDFAGGVLHFINLGEAPLMVALSIFSLCLWACSMIANHYFTDHKLPLALAFLLPNLILSAVVTRYVTLPLRPVFRLMRAHEAEPKSLVGEVGRIVTSSATESFGQAEIERNGAPLLVMVRTESGVTLPRGTKVVIFGEDTERDLYHVTAVSDPQLSDRS